MEKIPCSIQNWRDSSVRQASGKNADTALKKYGGKAERRNKIQVCNLEKKNYLWMEMENYTSLQLSTK